MIKIIGFIIISATGFLIGHDFSARLHIKCRELQHLRSAIELLMCEIEGRAQLIRALEKIGKMQVGRAHDFFVALAFSLEHDPQRGIVSAWNSCAMRFYEDILSANELSIFCSLAGVLASGESPKSGFISCLDSLSRFQLESENRAKIDGKMFTGLGLSSGIMLSIILM